ncbi:MAG: ribosomal L7Ae/L30e/S12e/Gadd45 family protein [Clostridia bacterium]|nr:ribosomal L7Ae/L30e/S12e/Gadd45 family protein [Clostridia bacterium]
MSAAKIVGALGLCRRAGKITAGTTLVKEEIRKGKAALVLLAADAAKNTEDKVLPLAGHKKVSVKRIELTKEEIGKILGKKREVVCVSVPAEFVNLVLASL